MESPFSAEFFSGNRAALRKLFTGTAPIVVTGNGLLQRSGDTNFPFQQDSSFWYLTGLDEPEFILVMDKDKEYLIAPERQSIEITFNGALTPDAIQSITGISTVLEAKEGWRQLESRLKRVKYVATLAAAPAYISGHQLFTNPARAMLIKRIKTANDELELLDIREHVAKLRMIKQHLELTAIRQAVDLTTNTLRSVMRTRQSYQTEYEVEAAITGQFRKHGLFHGYEPIVASGGNACTLHYIKNQDRLLPKNLLLIDVGANFAHYNADITRCYALQQPSKRQLAVHAAVLEVQTAALSHLKPGISLSANEQLASQLMGEKLRELGLIKSIDDENIRRYFPHATSHFLGIDVHDVGDSSRLLEPGMVLTVEPGIYIAEEGLGIRIEDDVVVTETGVEVLSQSLPRQLW